jgi:hypothetical protein
MFFDNSRLGLAADLTKPDIYAGRDRKLQAGCKCLQTYKKTVFCGTSEAWNEGRGASGFSQAARAGAFGFSRVRTIEIFKGAGPAGGRRAKGHDGKRATGRTGGAGTSGAGNPDAGYTNRARRNHLTARRALPWHLRYRNAAHPCGFFRPGAQIDHL